MGAVAKLNVPTRGGLGGVSPHSRDNIHPNAPRGDIPPIQGMTMTSTPLCLSKEVEKREGNSNARYQTLERGMGMVGLVPALLLNYCY